MKNIGTIFIVLILIFVLFISYAEDGSQNPNNSSESISSVQSQSSDTVSLPSSGSAMSQSIPSHLDNTPAIAPEFSDITLLDSKKYGWGPGKVTNHTRPYAAVDYQKKFEKYDSFFIGPDQKKIYLTFDEGYENGYTAAILDTLKEKKVSAVFFITYDYAKRNADLVKRMIAEGHIVGNHTHTHPSMPTVSLERAKEEIMFLHDYVQNEFNYKMTLFRFPMGEYNEQTLALCKSLGYKSVFWSFAYVDWNVNNQIGPEKAYTTVMNGAHNGAIYLLHAVSKDNCEILGRVIDSLTEQGYTIAKWDL